MRFLSTPGGTVSERALALGVELARRVLADAGRRWIPRAARVANFIPPRPVLAVLEAAVAADVRPLLAQHLLTRLAVRAKVLEALDDGDVRRLRLALTSLVERDPTLAWTLDAVALRETPRGSRPPEPSTPDHALPVDALSDLNVVFGEPLRTRFAFVVAFRNQARKLPRCLESIAALPQRADFGVILMDDQSTDGSLAICLDYARRATHPVVVVSNRTRCYYTRNLFNAVNLLVVDPDTVIVELDGDDYLERRDVLKILIWHYDRGAWQTFGSFRVVLVSQATDVGAVDGLATDTSDPWNLDRCVAWMPLKTYRKHLFDQIPRTYFFERDSSTWLRSSEDVILHPKMIEIAGDRARYIPDPLYVYDVSGLEHDHVDKWDKADYVINRLPVVPRGRYINSLRRFLAREARRGGRAGTER